MTTQLPESAHVSEAVAHLVDVLHPQIFNHSVRTFLLGRQAALRDGVTDLDSESLCLAALFHDSGTAVGYDGPARFEIEGADAAARFLQRRGWSAAVVDPIWEAIALHTTPGIPERRGPIAHYLRRGVEIEFGPAELRTSFEDGVVDAETRYPRTDLEEILQTLVVEQALRQPQKAAAPSWAADLVRNHQPGRRGVNPAF
jgi:HD domain